MIKKAIRTIVDMFIEHNSRFLVRVLYRNIWNLKAICFDKQSSIQKKYTTHILKVMEVG